MTSPVLWPSHRSQPLSSCCIDFYYYITIFFAPTQPLDAFLIIKICFHSAVWWEENIGESTSFLKKFLNWRRVSLPENLLLFIYLIINFIFNLRSNTSQIFILTRLSLRETCHSEFGMYWIYFILSVTFSDEFVVTAVLSTFSNVFSKASIFPMMFF